MIIYYHKGLPIYSVRSRQNFYFFRCQHGWHSGQSSRYLDLILRIKSIVMLIMSKYVQPVSHDFIGYLLPCVLFDSYLIQLLTSGCYHIWTNVDRSFFIQFRWNTFSLSEVSLSAISLSELGLIIYKRPKVLSKLSVYLRDIILLS